MLQGWLMEKQKSIFLRLRACACQCCHWGPATTSQGCAAGGRLSRTMSIWSTSSRSTTWGRRGCWTGTRWLTSLATRSILLLNDGGLGKVVADHLIQGTPVNRAPFDRIAEALQQTPLFWEKWLVNGWLFRRDSKKCMDFVLKLCKLCQVRMPGFQAFLHNRHQTFNIDLSHRLTLATVKPGLNCSTKWRASNL